MEIKSKIAIVTGASSGLGAAISHALIMEGATVYGLARNISKLENLNEKLGKSFIPTILDVSDFSNVEKWVNDTFSEGNSPDILVNNAGVGIFGKIDEMPSEDWYKMVNTNLNGMYNITSQVVKLMKGKRGYSHIINVGSILGITTRAEGAAYSATKYGISGFSESLFKELREFDIKVSCVNPGSIETSFFRNSGIASHNNMLQGNDIAQTIIHILKTPDNMLISEMTIRPLNPKAPD